MNKSVLLGIAAFGGLILMSVLFMGGESQTAEVPEEMADATTIPADFASQFPIYPIIIVRNVRESETAGSLDVSLSLETSGSREEIFDWYATELSQNGWGIKSDRTVAGYRIMQAEKENLFTSLQVANGEGPDVLIISQQLKVRKE